MCQLHYTMLSRIPPTAAPFPVRFPLPTWQPPLTLYENHIWNSFKNLKKEAKALIWPSSSPDSSLIDMQGLQQTAQPPEYNNALLCFLQQWLCLNSTCLQRKILSFLDILQGCFGKVKYFIHLIFLSPNSTYMEQQVEKNCKSHNFEFEFLSFSGILPYIFGDKIKEEWLY